MVFECNACNLELLAVVIEGRGKRVEEAGNHVHSKAVLGRTCEPGWRSWLKFVAFFHFMLHLPMSAQLAWLISRSVPWNLNLNNNVAFELRFESIRGEREPPSEFGISIV